MWLLILEALAALALLLFFVWWTMFSGRRTDARPDEQADVETEPGAAAPAPSATPRAPAQPPASTPSDSVPPRRR